MVTLPIAAKLKQLSMWIFDSSCFFIFLDRLCISVTPFDTQAVLSAVRPSGWKIRQKQALASSQPASKFFLTYHVGGNPRVNAIPPLVEACLIFNFGLGGPDCINANFSEFDRRLKGTAFKETTELHFTLAILKVVSYLIEDTPSLSPEH